MDHITTPTWITISFISLGILLILFFLEWLFIAFLYSCGGDEELERIQQKEGEKLSPEEEEKMAVIRGFAYDPFNGVL